MTFTKIRLTWGTAAQDTITFRFDALNVTDPYLVKAIAGLEPVTQTVSMSDKAEEGSGYQGKRPDNRQIVILLGFQPDYSIGQSVESLRRALYPMLSPKLGGYVAVQLLNTDETEVWKTWGYVSKMPTNPFSKDPEMQITIDCTSAYFASTTDFLASSAQLTAWSGKTTFDVPNIGDATTGFEVNVTLTAANTFFRLFTVDELNWIHITYNFAIGDKIYINTKMGSRAVTMTRGSTVTNMLQYFSPNTSWLQLDGGTNTFKPNMTGYTMTRWKHTPRFWGI
jgi:hypothetical protein